jgi:hypothetical protein
MTTNPKLFDIVKTWLKETYPNLRQDKIHPHTSVLLQRSSPEPNLLYVDNGIHYWADSRTPIKPTHERPVVYNTAVDKQIYPIIEYGWNYIDARHPNSFEILKTIVDSYIDILV